MLSQVPSSLAPALLLQIQSFQLIKVDEDDTLKMIRKIRIFTFKISWIAGTTTTIRRAPTVTCPTSRTCITCSSAASARLLEGRSFTLVLFAKYISKIIGSNTFIHKHYIKNLKLSTLGFPLRLDLRFMASLPKSN